MPLKRANVTIFLFVSIILIVIKIAEFYVKLVSGVGVLKDYEKQLNIRAGWCSLLKRTV